MSANFSRRSLLQRGTGAVALAGLNAGVARGEGRSDTLRYVTPGVVNTLDPVMLGGTPEASALGTYTYDRLLRFGQSRTHEGASTFDFGQIEGELADRYEVSPDGRTVIVHLRPGAAWHDGAPVTAEDVKWSLDRAVSANTMAKAQLASGSLQDPEQFSIVGPRSVQIRLERPDRLAVPNLATNYAPMVNSQLARRHASDDDPWATAWLKENTAGGGAFIVQAISPGASVTLLRNDKWAGRRAPRIPACDRSDRARGGHAQYAGRARRRRRRDRATGGAASLIAVQRRRHCGLDAHAHRLRCADLQHRVAAVR